MIRETIKFTSKEGDMYEVEIIEQNHRIFGVIPTVTLNNARIPPELFQNVLEFIISLDRYNIRRFYFENVRIIYRFITFQLFGHIRAELKKELKRSLSYQELKDQEDSYRWVESEFLPVIPIELEKELFYLEKKIKNMYWAFKRGKIRGCPYELDDDYKVVYNYFFELDPTDIKPIFDVYVNTKTPVVRSGNPDEILQILLGKFENLKIKMIFRDQ